MSSKHFSFTVTISYGKMIMDICLLWHILRLFYKRKSNLEFFLLRGIQYMTLYGHTPPLLIVQEEESLRQE